MIFPKDSDARSWVEGADHSQFPLQNLPYGVFTREGEQPRIGVAIGDRVLDLAAVHQAGLFDATPVAEYDIFRRDALNDFMAMGRPVWSEVRRRLVALLTAKSATAANGEKVEPDKRLRDANDLRNWALLKQSDVRMLRPCRIGAYVDFYSSKEHATNVGSMFRDPDNPLLPNWVHIPIGYHGRASTVVVSGTDIRRPCGQTKADDAKAPVYGPSRLLDIELEMGFFAGAGTKMGTRIGTKRAAEHIFGMVLVNDWSARDIQKWEYVPLGPFLGKSFATSVSPWVVPLEALEPFRVSGPKQEPAPLPYLRTEGEWGLDIELEILLQSESMPEPARIAGTNFKHMYWTIVQQLAHLTSNGCNIEPGDLYASGTVSGPTPSSYGSMLELAWRGTKPVKLPNGEERKFLADGDTVTLRGRCKGEGFVVGFGEVTGKILPADEIAEK